MRIYDGSPRQDFEEVLRSIGAHLDQGGMKDVLVLEVPDGFVVQALAHHGAAAGTWSETIGLVEKETMTFSDEDIARFMDEAVARRGLEDASEDPAAHSYELAFRVIGRYIDEQHPRDVFFFEQDGAFVVRLHHTTQAGSKHALAEFTRDDIAALVAQGPTLRTPAPAPGSTNPPKT
jgi:hypothetical protein